MHGQQAPCRPRGHVSSEQLMLCDMACRTNEGVVLKAPDHVVRGHFAQDQLSTARLTTHRPHALPRRSTRNRYYKHGPTCGVVIATLWICRGVPPCQPILCQNAIQLHVARLFVRGLSRCRCPLHEIVKLHDECFSPSIPLGAERRVVLDDRLLRRCLDRRQRRCLGWLHRLRRFRWNC
jgi:hypothetical protein